MKKVALLSNVNIDPLKNHLQKNDSYELYLGGYNQWQPELLNPSSGLYDFQPDFVFIYLNAEELKTDITELFSCMMTCILLQYPASASSMELSMTSYTR